MKGDDSHAHLRIWAWTALPWYEIYLGRVRGWFSHVLDALKLCILHVKQSAWLQQVLLLKFQHTHRKYMYTQVLYSSVVSVSFFMPEIKECVLTIICTHVTEQPFWGQNKPKQTKNSNCHLYHMMSWKVVPYDVMKSCTMESWKEWCSVATARHIYIYMKTETETERERQREAVLCRELVTVALQGVVILRTRGWLFCMTRGVFQLDLSVHVVSKWLFLML